MTEEKSQLTSSTPDFNKIELEILKFWEEKKIFEKSLEKTKDGEAFIFYDGPPFATGLPHYGSILPSVIKDCIPRYQTMRGKYVRRRWGWDCHGLPIENIVEQNLKISGKKQIEEFGVERFNGVCRENVLRFVEEWGKMVRRIARWVDFDNSYKTMDTAYMESVWWGLKQVWDKGLIYQDRKVLLYCSRCETPISNFEVAMDNSYREITEESVYSKFKMLPRQRVVNDLTDDRTYALAWTTTPWTLPGNTSLNLGPGIKYIMIEQNGERYILAKDRLAIIEGEYERVAEFSAGALENLQYEPLFKGVIPNPEGTAHKFYLADFVTVEDGTGIVHNAAMYGEEDYQLAKEKNLPRLDMLDHKGQYLERAPEHLRGVFFKDADKIVISDLKAKNLLYKSESYTHSYPHCYRCGTPLFYSALPAWFINIQKIKPELLKNNESINWYPEHLKRGRFQQGIENAPDWNISRNRYWATALPFWKCGAAGCGNIVCIGSVGELREKSINFEQVYPSFVARPFMGNQEGTADKSARYTSVELDSIDLHRPYIDNVKLKCDKCGGEMARVPEVVDCWVESGSMSFAELHYPFEHNVKGVGEVSGLPKDGRAMPAPTGGVENFQNRFPADFVVEYIPQTRAWFYVMHVISTILFGQAPFKNVLTTGTILGEDGAKMSKSKGNYPDPNLVIDKYGADALRFYLLTSPVVLGEDVNFSEKNVQEVNRKVSLILYNVWSFYSAYRHTRNHAEEKNAESRGIQPSSDHVLDKWILSRLSQVHGQVTGFLDNYDTVRAGKIIIDFINDLSTWYLRRSRDRIKESNEGSKQALSTLGFVLAETAKMLAPFMPFLADFLYKDLTGQASAHLEAWTTELPSPDEKVLKAMAAAREVVSLGLAARKASNIAVRRPLLAVGFTTQQTAVPEAMYDLIKDELNVKDIADYKTLAAKDKTARLAGASNVADLVLDLEITPELKAEGWARELERQIQDLRKKSGLKVGELVEVYYNTQDAELEEVLLKQFDRKKTFVSQISKSLEVEVDFETQGEVDGRAVWLGIVKI